MDIEKLKYPIGPYAYKDPSEKEWDGWIETIESLPDKLNKLATSLSYEQLETSYRPEGWSVKQVVHHLADSHMNSFIRFKLILTEDNPTVKPYREAEWAKTKDASSEDIADSLILIEGLHKRWATLLSSLNEEQRVRTCLHPEFPEPLTLTWLLGHYDWHCRHHLAHIQLVIDNQ